MINGNRNSFQNTLHSLKRYIKIKSEIRQGFLNCDVKNSNCLRFHPSTHVSNLRGRTTKCNRRNNKEAKNILTFTVVVVVVHSLIKAVLHDDEFCQVRYTCMICMSNITTG